MTELTIKNFKNNLSQFTEVLEKCRFVTVDMEFSALNPSEKFEISLFDDTLERYNKLRKNCELLIPIQIGITCFTFDRDACSYTADIYTIFIFPRSFSLYDKRFTCQSSSLQFLCDNKFDFNKFIYEGIPYINRIQEEEVLNNLKNDNLSINPSQIHEIEDVLDVQGKIISKWIFSAKVDDVLVLHELEKYKDYPDILYTIHTSLRCRFKDILWTYEEENKFKVKKVSKEQISDLKKNCDLNEVILLDIIGFTRLFRLLVTSKKPMIGHNLLTDLMLFVHNFERPLPKSYNQFKKIVNELFPSIYDTKCLSFHILRNFIPEGKQWQHNTLSHLYKYFKAGEGRHLANNSPLIEPRLSVDNYDQFHNAGWDSYCTGYIFIRMAHIYATNRLNHSRKFMSNELFAAVSDFKNKVNLIKASLAYIQLDGDDPPSSRPPYLVVESENNKLLNISQVVALLSSCGSVEVKTFSSGRKAIVAVDNFRSARNILRRFENHKDIRVVKYSTFRHSPVAKAAMWGSLFFTGAILAWIVNSKFKNNLQIR